MMVARETSQYKAHNMIWHIAYTAMTSHNIQIHIRSTLSLTKKKKKNHAKYMANVY